MRRSIILSIMLLLYAHDSRADMGSYARDYIASALKEENPTFYTACKEVDGDTAVLFLKSQIKSATLIEVKEGVVKNVGDFSVIGDQVHLQEANGGTWSYDRVQALASGMMQDQFQILTADRAETLLSSKAGQKCAEAKNPASRKR